MLKLVNPQVIPPGGIRFVDPNTGFKFNGHYDTFEDLERHIQDYRRQNNLEPLYNLRAVWENWVCQEPNTEKHCCPVSAHIRRSFAQYYQGGKVWIRTKLQGALAKFVKREVAEARAKTCVDCRFNVQNIGHNHARFYTDKFMRSQVGSRTTSEDAKLFTCSICTCLLRAKVHYSSASVAKGLSTKETSRLLREPRSISGKPLKCWQVQAIENVKNGSDIHEQEESSKEENGKKEGS